MILHIDMNSFFASVEQQANPFLRGKPIGVTGKRSSLERSVVAAASIEAKRLGVKTAMSTWEAKRICPSLLLVSGDPKKYSVITKRFNDILRKFSPLVERFSVDESFVDITEQAKDELGAIAIALEIRDQLRKICGELITASIGIAPNKFLAKLASESVKPNGLVFIRPQDAIRFLDTMDLQDACGIGPRTARHLEQLGVISFPQLRALPLDLLVREFKGFGFWLHSVARGQDRAPILATEEKAKSMGHSYTLRHDTWDPHEIRHYLLALSDRVAWRLRRDGFVANAVSVSLRYGDFGGESGEHRFSEPTDDGLTLFRIAWQLMEQWRDPLRSVRLVSIAASKLSTGSVPTSLFKKEQKFASVLPALDRLQRRYGTDAWTRASLLSTRFHERSSGFNYDHEV